MASVTRLDLLKRLFNDPKNYPYGFARSGDFSISESAALNRYGCLIAALVDGKIKPETEDDERLLRCALGDLEPASVVEKAWHKYQRRINRPRTSSIYGCKRINSSEDDSNENMDTDMAFDDSLSHRLNIAKYVKKM